MYGTSDQEGSTGLFVQIMTYKFGSKIEDVEDRLNEFLELVRRYDEASGTPLLVRCSPQRYQRCSLLTHVTFSSTPSSLAKIDRTPSNSCNSEMSTSGRLPIRTGLQVLSHI